MYRNGLCCLFFFSMFQFASLHAIVGRYEYRLQAICRSPELEKCWKKILKLPEARRLINAVQKEGAITLVSDNRHRLTQQFGAFWDPCRRVITINSSAHRMEGALIASIIFELHNASVNAQLINLDYLAAAGIIDLETYVQGVEKIEYKNSLNASTLAQTGIEKGIFPKTAQLLTYATFEEHYRIQRAGGHSTYIANNYNKLAPSKVVRHFETSHYTTHRPQRKYVRIQD